MRPSQSLVQLALCLSTFGPLASASGGPRWLPELDALIVQADSSDTASASMTSDTAVLPATKTGDLTATDSAKAGAKTTDLNTAKATQSGNGGKTGSGTSTATHTEFPVDSPPAGVSMQTPNTNLQPSGLYRMNDFITWSWNYTSLLGTPTAVDVIVSCSTASETWTLTANMSFETSVNYVWDTKKQANDAKAPLLNAMYVLIVKDSAAEITQRPEAGYLGAYTGYTFGMYTTQAYTAYPDWTCPGSCSAASSIFDHRAVGLAVMMSAVTVLSFTWFVSGLGLH
ncbi:hypothetical protein QQS21_008078 [Conoideocrella luteorostrata]|uniref:DUF7137 domain-containing protein n=1 Tax=Conoideocrella luteorostrata TaxID=1105319 RepID=A0AAJ0FRI9_9HYPO|nr:hypothetical protein QQS21_008078 [Conoideocrella luteorostrata]